MKDQLLKLSVRLQVLLDENGQDLVEYALLASFIGLCAIAGFNALENALSNAYGAFTTSENNNWMMPDPGSGGS